MRIGSASSWNVRAALLALAALAGALRAQDAEDEASPPPTPREAVARAGAGEGAAWSVAPGFGSLADRATHATSSPWDEFRAGAARLSWRPADGDWRLESAVSDRAAWRVGVRGYLGGGGRLDLDYRRARRSFFDDAPTFFDRGVARGAGALAYVRTAASGLDPDGVWDPAGLAGVTSLDRADSFIRRDLFSANWLQRLGPGELTVGLDLQRRRGWKGWSFVQSTALQSFPGPDGFALGDPKAVTQFLLPVDDRETALHAGWRQSLAGFRLSLEAGLSRHADGNGELTAADPWAGRPALASRVGQDSRAHWGALRVARRFGRHALSGELRAERSSADIPVENFTPYAPAALPSEIAAERSRSRARLRYDLALGDFSFALEWRRERRRRADDAYAFPQYIHPLAGAQLGFNFPLPVPFPDGLARTPRPMDRTETATVASAGWRRARGGMEYGVEAEAERGRETLAWRAVGRLERRAGEVRFTAGSPRGRASLAVRLLNRTAPPPEADFYTVRFIGPDWALLGEPDQALGFVAADLLGMHRREIRASGERTLGARWSLSGEAVDRRDAYDDARIGLRAQRLSRSSLALSGAPAPGWTLAFNAGADRLEQNQLASIASPAPPDPLDPGHRLPVALSTRVRSWEAAGELARARGAWRVGLGARAGGAREDAALGVPLELRTAGGRLAASWRAAPRGGRSFGIEGSLDWRRVSRRDGGDAFPLPGQPPIDEPVSTPQTGTPAPDVFLPAETAGPRGLALGLALVWRGS